MRNSNEISVELKAKVAETPASDAERATLASEIEALTRELQDAQINEAAQRALANQKALSPEETKDIKRFSISKMLRQAAQGRLDGVEAEMDAEARKEAGSRGVQGVGIPAFLLRTGTWNNAGVDTGYGDKFVGVTGWSYAEALRNAMVAQKAGVQFIDGLQGNVRIVKGGSFAGSWLTEESAASVEKPAFGNIDLTPKRLEILGGYTLDLLKQSPLAVDQIIWNEIVRAHAHSLDSAIFNGSGSSGQPKGIRNANSINTVALGDTGAAMDFAHLVQMETEVGADNGLMGSLYYVTNSKVMGKLKTTAQIAGYPAYLLQDGKANGYDVLVTNAIPSDLTKSTGSSLSSMLFGNFNDAVCGQWGGLDMIVDPYSQKSKGVIEIAAIAYHDVAVKHPESFCVCNDIVTA